MDEDHSMAAGVIPGPTVFIFQYTCDDVRVPSSSVPRSTRFIATIFRDRSLALGARSSEHIAEVAMVRMSPLTVPKLLKCWEIAITLGDVLLASTQPHPRFEFGPPDFLHALYQKLLPFLEQDPVLDSILRAKTAEVLVLTPARLLTTEVYTDWYLQVHRGDHNDNKGNDLALGASESTSFLVI